MSAPEWLVARPIAHRGLHDPAAGLIENTLAAADAAIAGGYAIECDVQDTADGEAVVFHDFTLDRLTRREAGWCGSARPPTSPGPPSAARRRVSRRLRPFSAASPGRRRS